MARIRAVVAAAAVGLCLAAGLAFGQAKAPPQHYDKEVIAAQEALEKAMMHLERVRGPHNPAPDRAYELALRAHTELAPLRAPGRVIPLN
jgi:hypothetical protein